MFRAKIRKEGMTSAIFGLWRNWALATGILTALVIIAPFIPRQWVAPLNVTCYFLLLWCTGYLQKKSIPTCSRLIEQVSWVILATAIVSVGLYFWEKQPDLHEITGQPYDRTTPFLVILVTAPTATLVTLIFWLNRTEPLVCRRCKVRYGNVIEYGFVGDLYNQEWRFQTGLLFLLSLFISVVDWAYYLMGYVNVNLNRSDIFFFVGLPLAGYIGSLVYLGFRYYSLWTYYCLTDKGDYINHPGTTSLRYLIVCGDKMFINFTPTEAVFDNGAKVKRFDTPAIVTESYHENENPASAHMEFRRMTGISGAEIRLIYKSPDPITHRNIFHYFAFIDNPAAMAESELNGEWMTWNNIMQLASQHLLDRNLVSELHRVYRVGMTWKTYDHDGRRLYPVKHYRPSFRLKDVRGWNVDYDDISWLSIAKHNQDSFWYPLRKLFHKLKLC